MQALAGEFMFSLNIVVCRVLTLMGEWGCTVGSGWNDSVLKLDSNYSGIQRQMDWFV